MHNYKALKSASKVSVQKVKVVDQAKVDAVARVQYKDGDDIPDGKEIGFDENNGIVQIDEKTTQHSMDYASMVVPLVKAVQELSAKVEALENAQ